MDLMKLLKSVEELLYEIVTWALFYPMTLWRCLRHPHRMMSYAKAELDEDGVGRFDDALSPPIFLLLTIFLAHLVELGFGREGPALGGFLDSEQNLLFFRALSFSIFPLILALQDVRRRGARLTKETLKPAFYSQCYATVPFVLACDLALIIGQHGGPAAALIGTAIFVVGLSWYFWVEVAWVAAQNGGHRGRAFVEAALVIAIGFVIILTMLILVALAIQTEKLG